MRELFRAGVLERAKIAPAPMAEGCWIVLIQRMDKTQEILTTQKGNDKWFKGVATAIEEVRRIGFRNAEVVIPDEHIPIKR